MTTTTKKFYYRKGELDAYFRRTIKGLEYQYDVCISVYEANSKLYIDVMPNFKPTLEAYNEAVAKACNGVYIGKADESKYLSTIKIIDCVSENFPRARK